MNQEVPKISTRPFGHAGVEVPEIGLGCYNLTSDRGTDRQTALETLQRAFQNIYDTMDEVDTFKLRALDSMKQTVTALNQEVEKSKGYIARAEGQAQAQAKVGSSEPSLLTLES